MTVVLLGIGADSINSDPIGPIHEDGRFEYIPIPETEEETAEDRTYATESFRFQSETTFADYLNWIKPGGDDERKKDTRSSIADHPLHYDPDFANLTYGESGSRSEYIERLIDLEPDKDAVAFYAGLTKNGRKHRYLIGYFVVNQIVHLEDETGAERERILRDHPDNAHSKRFFGMGQSKQDELVIVDGKEPSRLLDYARIKMSSYNEFGASQYYLSDDFVQEFPLADRKYSHNPESNSKDDKVWIGFKKPLEIGMDSKEFIEKVNSTDLM